MKHKMSLEIQSRTSWWLPERRWVGAGVGEWWGFPGMGVGGGGGRGVWGYEIGKGSRGTNLQLQNKFQKWVKENRNIINNPQNFVC